MRKHDVRKWLHAILDLLPVILIPVFMIYSHRHTIDSGSIDVPQNQIVDFNQRFESVNNQTFETNGLTVNVVDNQYSVNGTTRENGYNGIIIRTIDNITLGHKILFDLNFNSNVSTSWSTYTIYESSVNDSNRELSTPHIVTSLDSRYIITLVTYVDDLYLDLDFNFQCFDLTQMFGSGNEPTIEQFKEWYSDNYYSYTLSRKELLKGISTITYEDTDIMSQVVYQLYNSVDKYFNMGNVFNMTGVYDWFNLNIFNGKAPISIYIVWNIVLYEFVMDLLFLLYGLFMWFIDMVEKIMDKPFKSIK